MQSQMKVIAPVMTRDVTLPNSSEKVPMVMVPVPDSQTLMAIPLSTINNMTGAKDEQQAKDILSWNEDGVGTLDGCDLRFKINQLGCLELLDSDDEEDFDQAVFTSFQHARSRAQHQHRNNNNNNRGPTTTLRASQTQSKQTNSRQSQQSQGQEVVDQLLTTNNNSCGKTANAQQQTNSTTNPNKNTTASAITNNNKKGKIKQISPGCSLLRDGPDNRRARAPSLAASSTQSASSTALPLTTKRNETTTNQQQEAVILEKLLPKRQLDELKAEVENWTVEDVKSFVESIPGCSGTGPLFESQQICGKSLLYLDQKDLVDIVNVRLGPAIKICKAISIIKS